LVCGPVKLIAEIVVNSLVFFSDRVVALLSVVYLVFVVEPGLRRAHFNVFQALIHGQGPANITLLIKRVPDPFQRRMVLQSKRLFLNLLAAVPAPEDLHLLHESLLLGPLGAR
jgi:hypothetical protein